MNSKILIAFAAGAVLASGIVYMAVRQDEEPKPAAASIAIPLPALPQAPLVTTPVAETAASTAPVAVSPAPANPPRVRQKPSPMPPPTPPVDRRAKPVAMARNQEPPRQPAPQPVQEVVDRQPDVRPPVEAQISKEPQQPPPAPMPASPQAAAPPEDIPPAEPMPEGRVPHTVTIAAGTMLPVRIGETISAAHNQAGDGFLATLDRPLVVDGFIIAERGSRLEGRVVEAEPAGRAKSASHLGIELVKLSTADGQHIQIRTQAYKKEAASSSVNDATKVGVGAALGAAIGAVAGGGKGAAIGVGAGAVAGVAGAVLTRGKTAEIPVETRISFRIADPVTVTERLN
jgi:hypothetical protein